MLGRADCEQVGFRRSWLGMSCGVNREPKGTYDRGDTALRRAAASDGPDKGSKAKKGCPHAAAVTEKLENDF
jgi:hypothetical protein